MGFVSTIVILIIVLPFYTMQQLNKNLTYMLFISEDVPINYKQLVDTFDESVCKDYSIIIPTSNDYESSFDIYLRTSENDKFNETIRRKKSNNRNLNQKHCNLYIKVLTGLDREQYPTYTIRRHFLPMIHDNHTITSKSKPFTVQFSVVILDVNDHSPQFEVDHFRFNVAENTIVGKKIGQVLAHDPDTFLNGKITYTIFGDDLYVNGNNNSDRKMFRIEADSGELYLLEPLDYETKHEYLFLVEAKDHGNVDATSWPSIPSYADILIHVDDVNDCHPEIILTIPDNESVSLSSINKEDRYIINDMSPRKHSRMKNDSTSYTEGNDDDIEDDFINHFRLKSENESKEKQSSFQILKFVKEEPILADNLLALVYIRDNDNLANGELTLELQVKLVNPIAAFKLDSRCINDFSIHHFTENICAYLIENYFRLTLFRPNVYGLFNNLILDRDEHEMFMFKFTVDDHGNMPIQNINHLQFNNISQLDESSNTKNLTKKLKKQIRHRKRTRSLDQYHTEKLFSLKSEIYLHLKLLDINDNHPQFIKPYYQVSVDENQPRDTFVVRVHAEDIDKGENGTVRYELITHAHKKKQSNKKLVQNHGSSSLSINNNTKKRLLNKLFAIDSVNGIITTNTRLDYKRCAYYRFSIRAYDLGFNRKSSTAIVDIIVNNQNDHVSYFLKDEYKFFIEENLPIGTIVGEITVGDEDNDLPQELFINFSTNNELNESDVQLTLMQMKSRAKKNLIQYVFVDTQRNESSDFVIDSNGIIRTLVILDRETHSEYNMSIVIYDDELQASSPPAIIHIKVLDINDNAPSLRSSDPSHIISINQVDLYTSDDSVLYTLDIVDFDEGMNGLVTVNCFNCTPYFSIDQDGKVKRVSNMTVPNGFYTLGILLRDNGTKTSLETQHWLRLHINGPEHETNSPLSLSSQFYTTTNVIQLKNDKIKWPLNVIQIRPQIWFIILVCISWFLLAIAAMWTCYQYEKQNKEKKKRLLISQVRDHKIIVHQHQQPPYDTLDSKTSCIYTKLTGGDKHDQQLTMINHNKINDSFQNEDEIEDTSYDADGIIGDTNFVLTTSKNNTDTHDTKRN
ncbi:unnamed protein product, partial [Didymodactylos carnosus]